MGAHRDFVDQFYRHRPVLWAWVCSFTTATLLEVAFTMLIVNLRYTYSCRFRCRSALNQDAALGKRVIIAFGNTDEIFAVSILRQNRGRSASGTCWG